MASRNYASIISQPTPQREAADPRQVENSAGGFVFAVDDWARLDRFLVLGADAPTYYAGERRLTRENAACVERCLAADAQRAVARIVEVSTNGRAPKNDPAIFALAIAANYDKNVLGLGGRGFAVGTKAAAQKASDEIERTFVDDVRVRSLALGALSKVCRTGTHLFQFAEFTKALGIAAGRKTMRRGPSFVRHVGRWFGEKDVERLALQLIKYRARNGWTPNDMMRISHPAAAKGVDASDQFLREVRVNLYRWARGLDHDPKFLPAVVRAHVDAMRSTREDEVLYLTTEYKLPWEAIPTHFASRATVREALLPNMGLTAMIRQLGAMTAQGVLKPLSDHAKLVCDRLTGPEGLRRSRVHPLTILQALAVYRGGRSIAAAQRGQSVTWSPVPQIVDALDAAFIMAFHNVVPTGKRRLTGLDVSASMGTSFIGGVLSAREAACAMSMVTARTEQRWHALSFQGEVVPFSFGARDSLGDVMQATTGLPFGRTDCAQPMLWALANGIEVDAFEVYTDNETWFGKVHPFEALRRYRAETGIAAKLIVAGLTATEFSIADPADAGMLDVVGFDSAAPAVMADFIRGEPAAREDEPEAGGPDDWNYTSMSG